ncbi:HBL207Wp [Eremothecium sinecaudum]|uniref:Flap endonuclease 1 n=1 Tax=Eremothecium sinecaudum TaxID=45286 RepID=A0A109UW95_9SACH|nr:HBL207Wp [Eremothecium sinecaudum]AMD18695.1 HBL207Wp [Eremothecium sinecaudum]
MGIKGLNSIIQEHVPTAIKAREMKQFFGRKVAIDASMSLYQFLIAVRQQDGVQLATAEGETTSHLMGVFYRTLRMIDNGLKPCYVFDGKPPVMKAHELTKRSTRRMETEQKLSEVTEQADILKHEKRLVKVEQWHVNESKKLLSLMGIPFVDAPCEAEAQCAELARKGKVFAAASEDMDTLCYRTPYLLRHLTFSEARKEPVHEIDTELVLKGLGLSIEQFVDLGIMLGCDYCENIRGIGPVTALKLMKEHGSLDKVVEYISSGSANAKWKVPENWPYKEARELFLKPDVVDADTISLKWEEPKEEELIEFMCKEKGFNEDRIKSGIQKLRKGLKSGVQGRLDSFFKVKPKTEEELKAAAKRAKEAKKKNAQKGKVGKKR